VQKEYSLKNNQPIMSEMHNHAVADTHLHHEKHFHSSDVLQDVVIGMSDGLTVPFALAAGLSGAVSDTHIILTAGIAEIIAGSIAMGLGGFLSGKTEIDHYNAELKREYDETYQFPEKEKEEVREVFEGYGLSREAQDLIVEQLSQDRDKWVNFMMRFELGLEKPDEKRARNAAFNIGASYIVGGLIPLAPYAICATRTESLQWSCGLTLAALLIFGYFKSHVIGQSPWKGAAQTAFIGALAAAAAFGIARLLS
jgi:vacuolar iron transporter family protein